jgi:hypothetical protein
MGEGEVERDRESETKGVPSGWGARREETQHGSRRDQCHRWVVRRVIGWG